MRPAKSKHEKNSALIGMILGDGSMNAPNTLYIRHGGKQLDYVNEKVEYLSRYMRPVSLRDGVTKDGYSYRYAYYNNRLLPYLHKGIYINGRKSVTPKTLNRFTDVSLAFFYMDDGCLSLRKQKGKDGCWNGNYKSREIHLNIQSFTFDEAELFQKMLEDKFGLVFRMTTDKGNPRLWCNTKNTLKVIDVVKPIVSRFPTMAYKLDLKYQSL